MANKFVSIEYDDWTKKRKTEMKKSLCILNGHRSFFLNFTYITIPDETYLGLELGFFAVDFKFGLNKSTIQVIINDSESFDLAVLTSTNTLEEVAAYSMTQEELKKICEAKTISLVIKGEGAEKQVDNNEIIRYAQVFYNGAFDEKAYIEEVEAEEAKEAEVKAMEEAKEAEVKAMKEAEEKRINKIILTLFLAFTLVTIVFIILQIIFGGGYVVVSAISGTVAFIFLMALTSFR